jgi:hypothetical protein
MGTKARPSQLRPPAGVRQWQAREARRTARAASDRVPPGRQYAWPADKQAIITVTLAAAPHWPGDEEGRP